MPAHGVWLIRCVERSRTPGRVGDGPCRRRLPAAYLPLTRPSHAPAPRLSQCSDLSILIQELPEASDILTVIQGRPGCSPGGRSPCRSCTSFCVAALACRTGLHLCLAAFHLFTGHPSQRATLQSWESSGAASLRAQPCCCPATMRRHRCRRTCSCRCAAGAGKGAVQAAGRLMCPVCIQEFVSNWRRTHMHDPFQCISSWRCRPPTPQHSCLSCRLRPTCNALS